MADIEPIDLRKGIDRRLTGLKAVRQPWDVDNREVANYTQRRHSRFIAQLGGRAVQTVQNGNYGGRGNNRLFNPKAVYAMRTLKNGMSSGMSSPSQPWFRLKASDPGLADVQSVKEWIDDTTERMYALLSGTKIYSAMQSGYGELGTFGVEAGLMIPHWRVGAACYGLTYGEYWLGQDDALDVDTLVRDASMTVGQVYQQFGQQGDANFSMAIRNLKSQGKTESIVPLMHIIEPNNERVFGKSDKTNKPFRSVYWEPHCEKQDATLSFGGFDEKPFWAARWEPQGMEVYAAGPGFDCLPDSRKLQLQELRLQQSMDFSVRPALEMDVANRNAQANLIPGGITFSAASDMGRTQPIWQIDVNAIPHIAQDITRTETSIETGSYSQLWMAFAGAQGSAYKNLEEVARIHEEQLAQLGSVVDKVQTEKLQVIVMQTFSIMSKAGLLRPVPDELHGQPIDIVFVSILSQAQKLMGLGSMERALGFVGNIAGVYPQILDVPDFDDMVRQYYDRLGIPAKTINAPEVVEASRQARAQAEQQAKAVEAAPAMQAGAETAKLLSETDVNGQSLLQGLLPRPGA